MAPTRPVEPAPAAPPVEPAPTARLPVRPPVAPMLARLTRELPVGDLLYEPKWDGFRCLAFRVGDEVDLRSRHGRPLARYFPEIVDGLRALPAADVVLDGEIVLVAAGAAHFAALMGRLHPAPSRVERLSRETPAAFIAFDVLALDGDDLRDAPFAERRARLVRLLSGARPPAVLTPATDDPELARRWLRRAAGGGVDGVVAKPLTLPYRPGVRAMIKVKRRRTADCVVAGFRWLGAERQLGSLLLGLHDQRGVLEHVGVVTSFRRSERAAIVAELEPLVVALEGHPWEHGFLTGGGATGRLKGAAGRWMPGMTQDWVPVAPMRVCEVGYDQVDGRRFRHPARFIRWRPDRDPASCTFAQLEEAGPSLRELLPA